MGPRVGIWEWGAPRTDTDSGDRVPTGLRRPNLSTPWSLSLSLPHSLTQTHNKKKLIRDFLMIFLSCLHCLPSHRVINTNLGPQCTPHTQHRSPHPTLLLAFITNLSIDLSLSLSLYIYKVIIYAVALSFFCHPTCRFWQDFWTFTNHRLLIQVERSVASLRASVMRTHGSVKIRVYLNWLGQFQELLWRDWMIVLILINSL